MCNLDGFVISKITCKYNHRSCPKCGHGIFDSNTGQTSHSHCKPVVHHNQCVCGCLEYEPRDEGDV